MTHILRNSVIGTVLLFALFAYVPAVASASEVTGTLSSSGSVSGGTGTVSGTVVPAASSTGSGTVSGTVVTGSSGTISGTVVTGGSGTISGTVTGGGSSGGGSGGGGSGGGGQGGIITPGSSGGGGLVLGTSTTNTNLGEGTVFDPSPGVPSTGLGGDPLPQILTIIIVSLLAGLSAFFISRRRVQ